jgi:predicted metal-binding protein
MPSSETSPVLLYCFEAYSARMSVHSSHIQISETWTCGHCQYCSGKSIQTLAASQSLPDLSAIDMSDCFPFMFERNPSTFTRDECRTGARYLIGISSPLQSQSRVNKSANFGQLKGSEWNSLLALVRGEAIRRWLIC